MKTVAVTVVSSGVCPALGPSNDPHKWIAFGPASWGVSLSTPQAAAEQARSTGPKNCDGHTYVVFAVPQATIVMGDGELDIPDDHSKSCPFCTIPAFRGLNISTSTKQLK